MNDFQLTSNLDLKVLEGDLATNESTNQNIELIFKLAPGELKEHIATGVAIDRSINGNIDRFLDRTIRVQMESDDYKITKLIINETGVSIDGYYE